MKEYKRCVFCDNSITTDYYDFDRMIYYCNCINCGIYKITQEAIDDLPYYLNTKYTDKKHLFSGCLREKTELGKNEEVKLIIKTDNYESILDASQIPKTLNEKLDKLLMYFYRRTEYLSQEIIIEPLQPAICYAKNTNELASLLESLCKSEFLKSQETFGPERYSLTIDGFAKAEGISSINKKFDITSLNNIDKKPERTKVFVSYSHKDSKWLERLQVHMKPLTRNGRIDLWDDTRIITGQKWKEEIKKAIESAKVVILLISADFLASDFIANDELPPLLSAEESDGIKVIPVIVAPCLFDHMPSLSCYQAINDPQKTVIDMYENEQEKLWVKLASDIIRLFPN